jgi:hypothetical protein
MPSDQEPKDAKLLIIIFTIGTIIIFAAWAFWAYMTFTGMMDREEAAAAFPASSVVAPEPIVVEEVPAVSPVESVEVQAAPQPSQRIATVEPVAPVEEPVQIPWAAEMTEAGIAPSDQPIALELIMTGRDWNLDQCGCHRAAVTLPTVLPRFIYLNTYVSSNYGSWTAAKAQAAQGGW